MGIFKRRSFLRRRIGVPAGAAAAGGEALDAAALQGASRRVLIRVARDLAGNVLLADGLPPTIIDFSPQWAPAGFRAAILVADALMWHGADASVLAAVQHVAEFPQLLLRSLIFRIAVDRLLRGDEPEDDPFGPAVELACRLATG